MTRKHAFPIFGAALLLLIFLGTGCASTAKFDYRHAQGVMYQSVAEQKLPAISVIPFIDARPPKLIEAKIPAEERNGKNNRYLKGIQGSFAIGWLPLMPYAWMSTETPEDESTTLATLKNYWCKFNRELAEAAAESLEVSQCFKEVQFAETPENAKTQYIFRGVLHSAKYEGTRITYGLSYFLAPALWLLGAPDAVSKNTLEITFFIVDVKNNKLLWKYRFNGARTLTHFLYFNVGKDTANYAFLMKMAMNAALHDLETKIAEKQ